MAAERPNLILIVVDQWRADCLGFAGHPVVETPHLDRLARESTYFPQAYSATPTCIPARAALLTGLSQRSHGRVGYADGVDWDYEVTLPGLLADAGYHTQCIGKMHVHPSRSLLGFHNVVLHDGYLFRQNRSAAKDKQGVDDYLVWLRAQIGVQADYIDTGLGCNGFVVRPWIYDEMLHPTNWTVTQAIDFLRRRDPRKPFFLELSIVRPHPPFDPPAYYLDLYREKELPPLPIGDWIEGPVSYRELVSPIPADPIQRDRGRRAYFALITHVDHQLNRLFHALTEFGVLDQFGSSDNTAILFCADHGEMLYDHNLFSKALPYDGSARIPFLLRFPKGWDVPRGNTLDAPVELRDVLPTLCGIAGVDVPETVEGKSVIGLCGGDRRGWREYIHGEHVAGRHSNQWVTDGVEKYIWFSQEGREQLFDLAQDPQELHDLSQKRPGRVRHWRERLVRELEGREEGFVQDGELVTGRPLRWLLSEAGFHTS